MKIVISPAKSLNYESQLPTTTYTAPAFLSKSETIQKTLKKKKPKQLMELMDISEKLAELNWQRNQEWNVSFSPQNARPAVYAFDGDVYTGLDAYTLTEDKIMALQDKLRILSGLYGLLKPLDLMQPYRLEMGTSMAVGSKKNLYEFWKKTITDALNKELSKGELFLNLASNEYFSAVDTKALMISFFAKKARGMMVRYIIDTNAETIDDLKGFNYEGYAFDANLSKGNTLVFTR